MAQTMTSIVVSHLTSEALKALQNAITEELAMRHPDHP